MSTEIILEADYYHTYFAKLKIRYSWSATGNEFTCEALQYWATKNDEWKGNAYLTITIDGKKTDSGDFLNDNGLQNGLWHDIQNKSWTIRNVVGISAELRFTWTYDIRGDADKFLVPETNTTVWFIPRSPSINPIKNFITSPVRVTGTNAIPGFTLLVNRSFDYVQATASIAADGTWSADLQLPAGTNQLSINSHQFKGALVSPPSNGFYLYRAYLTSPTANGVVTNHGVNDFMGFAAPGTEVIFTKPPPYHGELFPINAIADENSAWQAKLTTPYNSGTYTATALFKNNPGVRSDPFTFRVLGYPVITNTELTVPLGFPITGRNRLPGATLTAYLGSSNTALGTAVAATTDTFSIITTNLDPGAHALTVEQFHSGKGSGRSAAVTFNVKPEPPVVTSTTTGERVKLHGTGFRGGQVHFHQPGDAYTPLFSVAIKPDGTFEYDVPLTQLPGPLHYSCRQSVASVGSARIYSEGWVQLRTNVPAPVPTQLTSARDGQKLVISGRGSRWGTTAGTVVIFNNDQDMRPAVPAVEVPVNLAWNTRSTADVAPGNYNRLTAKLWVNNLYSQPVTIPAVIIPSPPPELTPITGPTDQRPRITGTMWNGSKVEVQINGGSAKAATTAGPHFYLNATSDWDPATYTVSVTAEFGGQKSTPSTQSFTVRAPQPKILTIGPVPLQAIITGEGWKGCRVRIFTTIGNQELGADIVKSDGKFEIALLKQAGGDQTLYAVQYQSDNPANESVESVRVAVKFGIPTADVTVPPEGGTTPRLSTFSGTTTARSGTVELWLGGAPLRTNIAISNGTWSATGIKLDAGLKAVLVYIRDGNDLSTATTRNVKVVPVKLKIDSPLTNQYIGRLLWISGVGAVPGDQVIVRRLQTSLDFPPVTVDSRGYWMTSVQHDMTASSRVVAIARAGAGLDSETSDPIIPKLLHTAPGITQPQAGDRVGTKPVFSGMARPDATVTIAQWFNNTNVLATTKARADGHWEAQSTVALAEGGGWVLVRDTLNNQPSEWRRSERFEVRPMTAAPAAPSIQHP